MKEIDITGLHSTAQRIADSLPLLKNTMRGPQANEVGCMGKLVAMRYLEMCGIDHTKRDKSYHSIQTARGLCNVKTKERSVPPQEHYECTVQKTLQKAQSPDWFIFVSLQKQKGIKGCKRFTRGWILGVIKSSEFYSQARLIEPHKAEGDNGWSAKIPCYNLPVSSLGLWEDQEKEMTAEVSSSSSPLDSFMNPSDSPDQ
jgi:hypothetical protein